METNLNTITALPVSNDSPYFLQAENIKAIAELEFVFLFITENHTAGGDVMLPPAVAGEWPLLSYPLCYGDAVFVIFCRRLREFGTGSDGRFVDKLS